MLLRTCTLPGAVVGGSASVCAVVRLNPRVSRNGSEPGPGGELVGRSDQRESWSHHRGRSPRPATPSGPPGSAPTLKSTVHDTCSPNPSTSLTSPRICCSSLTNLRDNTTVPVSSTTATCDAVWRRPHQPTTGQLPSNPYSLVYQHNPHGQPRGDVSPPPSRRSSTNISGLSVARLSANIRTAPTLHLSRWMAMRGVGPAELTESLLARYTA